MIPIPNIGDHIDGYVIYEILWPSTKGLNMYEVGHEFRRQVYRVKEITRRNSPPKLMKISYNEHTADIMFERYKTLHKHLRKIDYQPGLPRPRKVGKDDKGHPYMIFNYLHGQTPIKIARKIGRVGNLKRTGWVTKTIIEVANTLQVLHNYGIIHRDIKDQNIIATNKGAFIIDLEGARFPEDDLTSRFGNPKGYWGTCRWSSPEQHRGERLSSASDVYSLGVLFFYLLSNRCPFRSKFGGVCPYKEAELTLQHMYESPPLLDRLIGKIPAEISDLVNSMLSKDPHARPTIEYIIEFLGEVQEEYFLAY